MEQDRFSLGRIAGVPVAVHWTVLVTMVWLLFWLRDFVATLIAAPTLLLLFIIHEFGHVLMCRRRRLAVYDILLSGLHGATAHNLGTTRQETAVAWGGVLAQLLVLVVALLIKFFLVPFLPAALAVVYVPILWVLIEINIFFIVIALIPIGPFDGIRAWPIFRQWRADWRRRQEPPPLTEAQHRDIERKSRAQVIDLVDRLSKKKGDANKKDDKKDTLH